VGPNLHISIMSDIHLKAFAFLRGDDDTKAEGKETLISKPQPYSVAPSALAMAKSVFTPGKTYRIRITKTAQLTASGAGALQLATSIAPSAGFAEYSALSALFLECRLRSTRISYAFTPGSDISRQPGFCSSFDPSNYSTTPTFAYACQQPGAKITSTFNVSTGNRAFSNSWKAKTARPYSTVVSTGSTTDPVGGVIGVWYHSISSASVVSVGLCIYLIECDYEFRNPL